MSSSFKCLLAGVLLIASSAVWAETVQNVHLEITTYLGDGQTFVEGDDIAFMLSLDQAAYVYLFYQDASGQLIQILPNREQTEHLFTAGSFIPVPDPEAAFKFTVQPPFGQETLWAFATDRPLPPLPGKALPNGMMRMAQDIEAIRRTIKKQSSTLFGEAMLTLKTSPR